MLKFILILSIALLYSQADQEPFYNQKIDKVYFIQYTENKPIMDGILNDAIWEKIIPIKDFTQEEPNNLDSPTEKTEVYITYDKQSLYVGARLYDSNPSKIVCQLAPRDDWYGAFDEMSDWFSIDIDSRHDHQTGYSFAVNASGVLSDEMVYNDSEYDPDWNAIWSAEVNIDEYGWTLEIEIPFSNLPFFEKEELVWGLNINRFIQRKYEMISWVVFPLDIEGVASKYGHLKGLKGIYPPAKFEFKPYLMTGITNYSDIRLIDYEIPSSWKTNYHSNIINNLGIDFQYRINTNSKFTFTVNPDFGQVESDPADVNLTAYETYFEEKRPFFLKDIDIFQTPIEMFYSRRIGEKAWGSGMKVYLDTTRALNNMLISVKKDTLYYDLPVIIKSAAKITGKTENGLSYGLLSAITTIDDSSSLIKQIINGKNRNYFVGRIKQDLLMGNSSIGIMTTSSIADSIHTFSIDGITNLLENQINISGQFAKTSKEASGFYANISYYPLGNFSGWIDYFQYDKGFDINSMGYLWRDDYKQTKFGIKYQSLEPWKMIRNASIIFEGNIEKNSENLNIGKMFDLNYEFQFNNFWNFGGGFYKILEHYDDRKIILDYTDQIYGPAIRIPEVNGSYFNLSTDKHNILWGKVTFTWADNNRNDTERSQLYELTFKPSSHLYFTTTYDRYRLNKQYHWLESLEENDGYHHIFSDLERNIDAITLRINGNISKVLSMQTYLEIYNNHDFYDPSSYMEFDSEGDSLFVSDYVLGEGIWINNMDQSMPVYTQDTLKLDLSYLDPNLYNGLYPKYTSMVFNNIIKWNYMKGSNIYLVYTANKSVNGIPFSGINGLADFFQFNRKELWAELLRDQTIMIKVDYWFEN